MSVCRITTPYNLTLPTESGGVNKDTWQSVLLYSVRGWAPTDDMSVPATDPAHGQTTIDVDQWIPENADPGDDFADLFRWCDNGAEIENYLVFHELADITKVVPAAYSAVYGDPTDTWENWGVVGGVSHAPVQIGSLWYRSTLYGTQGTPLIASAFYDFTRAPNTNQTGIQRIITVDEFKTIQEAATPPTP